MDYLQKESQLLLSNFSDILTEADDMHLQKELTRSEK